jgi:hypothetical protein
VPIHGHLIEQGLLAYAKSRGKRPFFYDPKRSRGGADSNPHYQKVGERLAEWVRTVAGEYLHSRASKLNSFTHRPQTGNWRRGKLTASSGASGFEALTFLPNIRELTRV